MVTAARDSLRFASLLTTTFLVGTVACAAAPADGGGSASAADVTSHGRSLVGNLAPDFSTPAVGSKQTVSLKKLRGQVVIVDFWGTFCEPCKKSFPKLQDLNHKYAAQGLQVVGISEDEAEDKDKIPTFAETYRAKFILTWDGDKSIAGAYKPETMPTSFVIDKKGVVRFVHVGYHEGEEVEFDREVKELLAR